MEFRPLNDFVLLEPLEDSQAGGLVIADDQKKVFMGKAVAVGEGRYEHLGLIKSKLAIGDIVYFSSFSKQEIRIDGKIYVIVPEKEALGYVRENTSIS